MTTDQAIATVTRFLRLVEERDLDGAAAYLADGAEIVFHGGRRFTSLAEQVAASRYRNIRKQFERFDVVAEGPAAIVYVIGWLSGVDASGERFDGVRFIDRLVLVAGRIVDHRVWNDLQERPAAPGAG